MDYYLDRYHSAGNGMDKISMGHIQNQLSNEELTYGTLFETLVNVERLTNRLIVFEQKKHEWRHFPRFYYLGGDRITLHVNIYLNRDDQTDSRHTHLLRQIGIAVVLSCSVYGLVSALDPEESYDSFAKQYKEYSDKADELYVLLDKKLNKDTI